MIPTLFAYLTEWLTVYAGAHCKPSTAQEYRKVTEKHLSFGEKRLQDVTRTDLKRFIAGLIAEGRRKRTIHDILTPLKEAYHHAIDDGLVTVNPVAHLARFLTTRKRPIRLSILSRLRKSGDYLRPFRPVDLGSTLSYSVPSGLAYDKAN